MRTVVALFLRDVVDPAIDPAIVVDVDAWSDRCYHHGMRLSFVKTCLLRKIEDSRKRYPSKHGAHRGDSDFLGGARPILIAYRSVIWRAKKGQTENTKSRHGALELYTPRVHRQSLHEFVLSQ